MKPLSLFLSLFLSLRCLETLLILRLGKDAVKRGVGGRVNRSDAEERGGGGVTRTEWGGWHPQVQ